MATLTLPIEIQLSSKSKQLLDFLRTLETPDPESKPVQPKPVTGTTPPAMGEYWPGQGGRYICTLPALLGMPARHLIAADKEFENIVFGPRVDVPGATSHIDGAANTKALLANSEDHKAAFLASDYTKDGHSDFFLPARLDMVMAHICAPHLFQKSSWYWTSTQISSSYAFVQDFEGGYSDWHYKDDDYRVRPCRVIQL
jgi:hypothetical protein